MESVEEVTVVGKRIRRWLPIIGADWPDKDCRLSARDVGRGGPRVVFIADLGRSGRAWRHVAHHARVAGVHATLVTLPGSDGNRPCTWRGAVLSRAAELVTTMVEDGRAPVALVGDTFGAHVALEVALRVGAEEIHNLVLFDLIPYPWSFQNLAFKAYRRTHTSAHFAAQARLAPPGHLSVTTRATFPARDFPDEDVREELMRVYARSDPVTVSYEYFRTNGPKADLRPLIAAARRPILAIAPTGPIGNERKNLKEVARQYADVQDVTWYALSGHGAGAMLEAPELMANAMLSFWADVGFHRDPMHAHFRR